MVSAFGLLAGCAASVPEVEHRALLRVQQEEYEDRLRRAEAERARSARDCAREVQEARALERRLKERIDTFEQALAEKERVLDETSSRLVELQDAGARQSGGDRRADERSRSLRGALAAFESRLSETLKDELGGDRAILLSKEDEVTVRFKDGALFLRGSSRFHAGARASLERIASAIKASGNISVRVDVHTDAVRPQEGLEIRDTWSLTEAQGAQIVRGLGDLGVDPSRLSYASFGQFRPIASNETAEGRAENRRVEIHFSPALGVPSVTRR